MKKENKFEIGFWHPFGPHAGEKPEDILKRKQKEINKNGWTLWSFQFRNTLLSWYQEIMQVKPRKVLVFCSEGKGALDPKSSPKDCGYYLPINEDKFRKIPAGIHVPHPMGKRSKGSAFIVKKIIYPSDFEAVPIEWFKNGQWQINPLPTRPEYLIRLGKGKPMRPVRAILELKYPYIAEIGSH